MFDLQTIKDLLSGRSRDELAKVAAYILAPGLVMCLSGAGVYTPGWGLDFSKPVAISELLTEISVQGQVSGKRGVVLTLEPTESEYQIPLSAPSSMWISLEQDVVRSNSDRLILTDQGFRGKSPLIGVSEPVAVVLVGELGKNILVPGGAERLDGWRLQSRRSLSLVSSTLLACVFAFGMSLATGLPSIKAQEQAAGKVGAKPNEQ